MLGCGEAVAVTRALHHREAGLCPWTFFRVSLWTLLVLVAKCVCGVLRGALHLSQAALLGSCDFTTITRGALVPNLQSLQVSQGLPSQRWGHRVGLC